MKDNINYFVDDNFKISIVIIFVVIIYYSYILISHIDGILILDFFLLGLVLIYVNKIKDKDPILELVVSLFTIIPIFLIPSGNMQDFLRLISLGAVCFAYFLRFLDDALFEYPFLFIVITIINVIYIGTVGIYCFEDMTFLESFWYTVVSATTVGYGDYVAKTIYGQFISIFIIISGTIVLGAVLTTIIINKLAYNRSIKREKKKAKESETLLDKEEEQVYNLFDYFKKGDLSLNKLQEEVLVILKEKDDRSK